MILHDYFRSSSAFRVRIALNIKGIDYETKVQDLDQQSNRSKGYLRVNGFGLIPAIEDGEVRIAQSGAIIEYLEEKFSSPALLPLDPAGRARVRSLFIKLYAIPILSRLGEWLATSSRILMRHKTMLACGSWLGCVTGLWVWRRCSLLTPPVIFATVTSPHLLTSGWLLKSIRHYRWVCGLTTCRPSLGFTRCA